MKLIGLKEVVETWKNSIHR